LLDRADFDIRLHGVHGSVLPADVPIPTTAPPSDLARWRHRLTRKLFGAPAVDPEMERLAQEIREWRPHVVHTLGLEPASYFFLQMRRTMDLPPAAWVVTARGGPELALHRFLPDRAAAMREVFQTCDQLIADNELNYRYAIELGLAPDKAAPFGRMPGVGGVDIEALRARRSVPAARSRVILVPKAYDCPASKVLPVFEALKLCWDSIRPCEVHFTAATEEARIWFATLPQPIRDACRVHDRISRDELLALMGRARIMLMPSLTDGVPNMLYEAMASGCAPIVSPIETLTPLVADGVNVLFARNLYPQEIADALARGMSDDRLVESMAAANAELVPRLADRARIRPVAADNYRALSSRDG
jgi:hypothetical protein